MMQRALCITVGWVGLNACCVELQLPVYLYERIFAVHGAVITLAEYLNVLLELLSLCHAHDATPLIVYFHSIHVAIGLLFLLPFNQPQPVDQGQAKYEGHGDNEPSAYDDPM